MYVGNLSNLSFACVPFSSILVLESRVFIVIIIVYYCIQMACIIGTGYESYPYQTLLCTRANLNVSCDLCYVVSSIVLMIEIMDIEEKRQICSGVYVLQHT